MVAERALQVRGGYENIMATSSPTHQSQPSGCMGSSGFRALVHETLEATDHNDEAIDTNVHSNIHIPSMR